DLIRPGVGGHPLRGDDEDLPNDELIEQLTHHGKGDDGLPETHGDRKQNELLAVSETHERQLVLVKIRSAQQPRTAHVGLSTLSNSVSPAGMFSISRTVTPACLTFYCSRFWISVDSSPNRLNPTHPVPPSRMKSRSGQPVRPRY